MKRVAKCLRMYSIATHKTPQRPYIVPIKGLILLSSKAVFYQAFAILSTPKVCQISITNL